MVAVVEGSRSCETWERHPAGDEVVICLSDRTTIILDIVPESWGLCRLRATRGDRSTPGRRPLRDTLQPGGVAAMASASAAVAPGRISGKLHVAPAAPSASESGCEPPTNATSISPAARSPADSAVVTCSGVQDVGIHQCQTLQSVTAHSPRTGAEPGPAGDPDRNARLLNAGRCGHPSAGARDGYACEHLLEQADPGIKRGGSSRSSTAGSSNTEYSP